VLVHFRLTRIQRHSGQALALHPVPGTDLGTLFASIDLASHPVPGTDSGTLFASIDLASHPVPGTDSGTLFASIDLASHLVPGTDSGTLSELLYDNLHCRVSVSSCRQAQRTLP
jgi:hypothetical protein